jgi:hypothetical protein
MPGGSHDLVDSFEDRDTGAQAADYAPWVAYVYSGANNAQVLASGVDNTASDGNQSVFLIVTNPPDPGGFSGYGLSYTYPQSWSLPHDLRTATNYTFSFDFREQTGQACVLELQLIDVRGGQIHFAKTYQPDALTQWDTVRASLDQFTIPPSIGFFDSTRVSQLAVNVQMLQPGTLYQSSIDNIRFQGPEVADPVIATNDVWDGFEDRDTGEDPLLISPWTSYVYSESNNVVWLGQGVNSEGIDGGHAAFVVVTNPPNSGTYAGFGISYAFSNSFALPVATSLWTNYTFSFAFKETSEHHAIMEMQVQSAPANYIHFTKEYVPDANGWCTVRASLDQFTLPSGVNVFDPTDVQAITVNIAMLDAPALYIGLFDNIYFDAPDQALPGGPILSVYDSANDMLRIQSIGLDGAGRVVISWLGNAGLQAAPTIDGVWTNVPNAASPYTAPPAQQQLFYRLYR